jgi:hypothetical protein
MAARRSASLGSGFGRLAPAARALGARRRLGARGFRCRTRSRDGRRRRRLWTPHHLDEAVGQLLDRRPAGPVDLAQVDDHREVEQERQSHEAGEETVELGDDVATHRDRELWPRLRRRRAHELKQERRLALRDLAARAVAQHDGAGRLARRAAVEPRDLRCRRDAPARAWRQAQHEPPAPLLEQPPRGVEPLVGRRDERGRKATARS